MKKQIKKLNGKKINELEELSNHLINIGSYFEKNNLTFQQGLSLCNAIIFTTLQDEVFTEKECEGFIKTFTTRIKQIIIEKQKQEKKK